MPRIASIKCPFGKIDGLFYRQSSAGKHIRHFIKSRHIIILNHH